MSVDFALIYPMFALVVLTWLVGINLMRARIGAARRREAPMKYFKTMSGAAVPEPMDQASRHFSNLFETPVLFYAGCFAAIVTQATSPLLLSLAWIYVGLRVVHAWIHLGRNKLIPRLVVFATSFTVVMLLWLMVVIHIS